MGYTQYVGDGIVSWSAKKQPIVTLSSIKAEYVALTHATKYVLWIRKIFSELHPFTEFGPPMDLYCDNQGAIRLSKDSTFHGCTKHIDVHFHFIQQMISTGAILLKYCPTEDMIANVFTKSLARVKFEKFHNLLGLA